MSIAPPPINTDAARDRYIADRVKHWDDLAELRDKRKGLGGYYRQRLAQVYGFLIPPGSRVLELGCSCGDLLASLRPAVGVGVDFSPAMIERARKRHPEIRFELADAHTLAMEENFDFIILSDLINDLWNVQEVLEQVQRLCTPRTRVILNFYSHLWEGPLGLAERLGLAKPTLHQNWMTREDVANLLHLTGFESMRAWQEVLWPVATPLVAPLCNRWLVKLSPFRFMALTNFMVARPAAKPSADPEPRVSVIVPARNEEGNIEQILQRVPEMGGGTEIVFVEGNSTDDTYGAIQRAIPAHPQRTCKLLKQPGRGKGDAVRAGYDVATGDIFMILDADLTVAPEDLPKFYQALRDGKGEFINGVRLVYPMEDQAMRFANLLGNKFFSMAFTWLLGQSVKDTLCGTKVLWREDYRRLAANRAYFGDFDPFGDFDLLFGAAKLSLRIVDLPIRYRQRTYGATNISRWKHGLLLLRMCAFAARRLKFV